MRDEIVHKFGNRIKFKVIKLCYMRVWVTIIYFMLLVNGAALMAYDDLQFAQFPKKVMVSIPTVTIENVAVLGMMNEVAEIGKKNNLLTSDDVVQVIFSRDSIDPELSTAVFYVRKNSIFKFNLIWDEPFSFAAYFGSINYHDINFIFYAENGDMPSGISFHRYADESIQIQYIIDTFMIKSDVLGTTFDYLYDDKTGAFYLIQFVKTI